MRSGSSACPRRGTRHLRSIPAKARRCERLASNSSWPGCMRAIGSRGRRSMGGLRMKSDKSDTPALLAAEIINRGRGPEIKGTRITVYDVLDYVLEGWSSGRIATCFNIGSRQVDAAIHYIREHTIEVLTEYVKILERCA